MINICNKRQQYIGITKEDLIMNTSPENLFGNNVVELQTLEWYLEKTLQPYTPSPDFVCNLREKIIQSKSKNLKRTKLFKYGIFGTAGVLSGVILVATSIRTVVTIFGAVRMLRNANMGIQN